MDSYSPEDPTILSGTLRSTLDVFEEYEDAEIVSSGQFYLMSTCLASLSQFEALQRVHLIPPSDAPEEEQGVVNANVFRNLDSPVSEGGDNFSTG
jgi:ABC-type multidrug transport system fused ATPase/permease subunit